MTTCRIPIRQPHMATIMETTTLTGPDRRPTILMKMNHIMIHTQMLRRLIQM